MFWIIIMYNDKNTFLNSFRNAQFSYTRDDSISPHLPVSLEIFQPEFIVVTQHLIVTWINMARNDNEIMNSDLRHFNEWIIKCFLLFYYMKHVQEIMYMKCIPLGLLNRVEISYVNWINLDKNVKWEFQGMTTPLMASPSEVSIFWVLLQFAPLHSCFSFLVVPDLLCI